MIWDWTQRREEAFRHLRAKLLEEPIVLAFPDWNTEFVVESDASSAEVAAVLSQRETDTGLLCLIDYFSSSLSQAQINYSAGQLETWGLVAACRMWRTYLRGADKVQLMTDHKSLRWMRGQKDPRHTFARWIMEFEEYKYEIIYRPGKENVLPDYLSRIPGINMDMDIQDEGIFEDKIFMVLQDDLRARVIQEKGRNPVTRAAIEQMRCGREIASGQLRRTASHLNLHEGVLYFDTRLVIPKAMQMEILNQVHTAGNFKRGPYKCLEGTASGQGWPAIQRIIVDRALHASTQSPPMQPNNLWVLSILTESGQETSSLWTWLLSLGRTIHTGTS